MLTPRFELSQTDSEVVITVHAPFANIKDTEVYVEGNDFRFYSTPYYLRLKLPGEIIENDESSGSYDCEKGDFFLKFSKVNKGQHFENMDMITTLLAPPKENKDFLAPKIQVISNPAASEKNEVSDADDEEEDEKSSEVDWSFPPTTPACNETTPLLLNPPKYGFANKVSGALGSFDAAWIKEVIDLPTPDNIPQEERRKMREAAESEAFDEDHYMADLIPDECIDRVDLFTDVELPCHYLKPEEVTFTDKEKDLLKELPNKEYLLDNDETKIVLFGMVDILFGCCYNNRITLGENTTESSWDVNKLSSTLCWFETFSSAEEVVRACFRRSLCYPLCRHWNLSMKTFEDVKTSIKLGKKYVIKKFCEIHEMFNDTYEPRYLLNQLYIKDYLIWLQKAPASLLECLLPMLEAVTPKKGEMGFDLEELEVAAWSVHNESLVIKNVLNNVTNKLDEIKIDDNDKAIIAETDSSSDSDSDSDSSDSSDTSSSSDCTSSTSSNSSTTTTTSEKSEKLDSDDLSNSGSA